MIGIVHVRGLKSGLPFVSLALEPVFGGARELPGLAIGARRGRPAPSAVGVTLPTATAIGGRGTEEIFESA